MTPALASVGSKASGQGFVWTVSVAFDQRHLDAVAKWSMDIARFAIGG